MLFITGFSSMPTYDRKTTECGLQLYHRLIVAEHRISTSGGWICQSARRLPGKCAGLFLGDDVAFVLTQLARGLHTYKLSCGRRTSSLLMVKKPLILIDSIFIGYSVTHKRNKRILC